MNVIKVSEILPELEQSKKKKENEKEHVLELRDSLNKMISLGDSFKGNGADAIKDHLTLLHIPAVLMLNLFIENYLKNMDEVKKHIQDFEEESGFVNQDFLEKEVKTSIQTIEELAGSSIKDINKEISSVSDIIGMPQISLSSLTMHLDRANDSIDKTVEDLKDLNQKSSETLKKSDEELSTISDFIDRVASWESKGITLDSATIKEIDKYFADNETIKKLVDSAVELSIKDGDATTAGNVADWLDKLGKLNGGLEATKGALSAATLFSNRLIFEKDGKGNFYIKNHPNWVQNNNRRYNSKLADSIHKVLKMGSSSSISTVKNAFKKYQNAPSNLLRALVGLKPGTTKISYNNILKIQHPFQEFSKAAAKVYSNVPADIKKTFQQLTDKKALSKLVKKVPVAGTVFSVGTNFGEFTSDKNKYKSNWEKGGRAAAGIGMDVGVAGLATGGAAIGTLICPGVGTLIGGAVGATVGIVSSIAFEDTVKDLGEKAGKWVGEKVDDLGDNMRDAGKFVTGLFK